MHNTNYTDSELFNSEQFKIDLEKSKSEVTVFRDALTKGNDVIKTTF